MRWKISFKVSVRKENLWKLKRQPAVKTVHISEIAGYRYFQWNWMCSTLKFVSFFFTVCSLWLYIWKISIDRRSGLFCRWLRKNGFYVDSCWRFPPRVWLLDSLRCRPYLASCPTYTQRSYGCKHEDPGALKVDAREVSLGKVVDPRVVTVHSEVRIILQCTFCSGVPLPSTSKEGVEPDQT